MGARVAAARELARERGVRANAAIPAARLDQLAPLHPAAERLLERRLRAGTLSARGFGRIRRVARTLADLAGGSGAVEEEHVCLALALRARLGSESSRTWVGPHPDPSSRLGRRDSPWAGR
ncbi:MAG: magnesium chelatase subunit ChlI family protein [Acidimicrobiales bacterium]